MGTRPYPPEPEPTREERVATGLRVLLAGHPQGAVRRIALYLVTLLLVISPLPALAVVPLALLAMTDMLA